MPGTTPTDPIVGAFEAHRARLTAVARRVLGSRADAEDVVQEAWLRLSRQDAGEIDNLGGWLTTVVGRISLDVLRSRRTRPVVTLDDAPVESASTVVDALAPEESVTLDESVNLALMTVLDSLRPEERLVFVLHDVFTVPYRQIGPILGKSTDATKMLASRARGKVREARRPVSTRRRDRAVVGAFLDAAREGRFTRLVELLNPQVEFTVHTVQGRFVTRGAEQVASRARLAGGAARAHAVTVDGRPGVLAWGADGAPSSLLTFTVSGDHITAITAITDPVALADMGLPGPV
ncbi:RNA polymerase sigma-70 factor (ECF subfamily) [Stackebrandtia albiflava]|uniref:RNA polymerase sigma-70 factor (ECF subfamily) n=1 Tax=Stackebrandtia albiflava TaxID=406432 RepID=A0A562VDE3_9ACTN|nr:sigma-70 family RNA polymerase sigma factor [Stackebrandtia albiflava]TWJ15903.1 RNA polymerase sigma-70 factor (ECF subfamily) [Stackebrandtia albiflava]